MRPVEQTPFLQGHNARFRARLAAGLGEDDEVEQLYRLAVRLFEGLQMPYYTAVARAELAEWLVAHARGGDAEPLLDQSREAFQHLQAAPWLERLSTVTAALSQPAPAAAE